MFLVLSDYFIAYTLASRKLFSWKMLGFHLCYECHSKRMFYSSEKSLIYLEFFFFTFFTFEN